MLVERILKVKFPYPRIGSGKHKKELLTLNNFGSIHWSLRSSVKQGLKAALNEWFFAENPGEPYTHLVLTFQTIAKDKRNHDAVNMAPICKIAEDVLVDLGWVNDDDKNKIILEPTVHENVKETMIEVIVEGVREQ